MEMRKFPCSKQPSQPTCTRWSSHATASFRLQPACARPGSVDRAPPPGHSITGLEIPRCAALLLKEPTIESALLHAAGRAEEERKKGDLVGHAVWLQIIDAINGMIRTEKRIDEPLR